ncbi:sigma-70 family RNA polymerase sigma factor [Pseudonocardia xishanensis]|uniref:Sigma-70 family RNA polymerase sigma factor n=1 Tax=Pseudonocardia xishanensis TaxID=630995 RepID=A0ABP8S0V0_9PSEU
MPAHVSTLRPPGEEDTLLPRLARGDSTAWREVVTRYERLVRARVRGFRLQPADAEDAVAATWLRLAQNADRIQHAERLAGWLSTVAGRECLRLLDRSAHAGVPVEDVGLAVADTAPGPEQRALDADTARELRGLVASLPRRRRLLIAALFGEESWSYDRISADIGIPTGSIGPTRARALDQLRAALAAG